MFLGHNKIKLETHRNTEHPEMVGIRQHSFEYQWVKELKVKLYNTSKN